MALRFCGGGGRRPAVGAVALKGLARARAPPLSLRRPLAAIGARALSGEPEHAHTPPRSAPPRAGFVQQAPAELLPLVLPPVGVSRALNVSLKSAQSADELLLLVAERAGQFDAINASTAWNVLGSFLAKASDTEWRDLVAAHGDALHALLARTRVLLPRFGAWSLSNSAHGLSRARLAQSPEHRAAALDLYAAIGAEAPRALAAPVDMSALADVTVSAAMASASLATAGVGCAFAIGVLSAWSLSGALTAASATHVAPSYLALVAPAAVSTVCAVSAIVVSRALWEGATVSSRLRPPQMRSDAAVDSSSWVRPLSGAAFTDYTEGSSTERGLTESSERGRPAARTEAAPSGTAAGAADAGAPRDEHDRAALHALHGVAPAPIFPPSAEQVPRGAAGAPPAEAAGPGPSRALWSGALTAVATSAALGVATARAIADTLPLSASASFSAEGTLALTALPAGLLLGASAAGALLSSHLYRSAASGESAPPLLVGALRALGVSSTASFRPAAVANLAWAFAQADVSMPPLFKALSSALAGQGSRLREASVANLVTLAGSYARAGVAAPPELFDAIGATAAPQLATSPHHLLTTLAHAYTKAHARNDALFDALAAELQRRAGALPPHALTTTAWAYAQTYGGRAGGDRMDGGLCLEPRGGGGGGGGGGLSRERKRAAPAAALVRRLAGVAEAQVEEWGAHDIAALLWALAVARCYQPAAVWERAWCALHAPGVPEAVGEVDAAKLFQVALALQLEAPPALALRLGALAPCVRERGERRLRESSVHESDAQRHMSRALETIARSVGNGRELVVAREVRVHGGAFSVDAIVSCRLRPERRIAVEMDGPTHFVGSGPPDVFPNGSSAFKRRLLARLGWRLVHVPWWEWEALGQPTSDVHVAYLRAKLQVAAWPGMFDAPAQQRRMGGAAASGRKGHGPASERSWRSDSPGRRQFAAAGRNADASSRGPISPTAATGTGIVRAPTSTSSE